MTAMERITDRLADLGLKVRPGSGGNLSAQCPAHDDRNPSLSLRQIEGMALVKCFAGCETLDVMAALGLTLADLYDEPGDVMYDYTDANGNITRQAVRTPDKRFHQRIRKHVTPLYRLPKVQAAVAAGKPVYLVEGEKDAHALESKGVVATTGPGGADNIANVDFGPLKGATVIAVADRDAAGAKWAGVVRARLVGHAGSVTVVEAKDGKDAAEHVIYGYGVDEFVPVDAREPAALDTWDAPIPLGHLEVLPAFPVAVFPDWLATMVTATAEFTQTDESMAGTVALSVLAACAGGRLEVEARQGWREPTNLFVAVVAAPGERKSPVQAALTAPLRHTEAAIVKEAKGKITEQQALKDIAAQSAHRARLKAASADGDHDALAADAVAAALAAEAITVPTLPRLLADDTTPEALASLMAANGGKIALISDEGGIFDMLAGRYSAVPNLDPFLKGHAGTPMVVDRKGRDPEFIAKPALTVGLMFQPAVLRTFGANAAFRGRGLVARFLFTLPPSRVGSRNVEPESVPTDVAEAYANTVTALAKGLAEWHDPAVVALSEPARKTMVEAHRAIEDRLRPGGDLSHIADWANKLTGLVVRLAGLLHIARYPDDGWRRTIEQDCMADAVTLVEFFTVHYRAAIDTMDADPAVEAARHVLTIIGRLDTDTITVRDLFSKVSRSRFRKVGDLNPALTLLAEHNWIRRLDDPEHTGPGRKRSPSYAINPAAQTAETAER